ncbi:UvrD-helicase domain-containing protein [Sulfobacillus thermosulfidooxidans]|uniref:UvrD-helicase domain-containing protein n=1 Tax=Sulfobacillus thermosulfidooxidans TaxID=28034 RepID=UPI0006B4015B|nr:UvrD-helicase domain-containing protein [Sulfobacillus thermosulfidooxidans]
MNIWPLLASMIRNFFIRVMPKIKAQEDSLWNDSFSQKTGHVENPSSLQRKKAPLLADATLLAEHATNDLETFKHELSILLPPDRQPTREQWNMVLSQATSTAVIAGAGSGKSTTLAQRILLLNQGLGVPPEAIKVFSFTKASAEDLQKTLFNLYRRWEAKHPRSTNQAGAIKQVVSTFHSTAKAVYYNLTGVQPQFFEFLGKNSTDASIFINPMILPDTQQTAEQQDILNKAHIRAWEKDQDYRDAFLVLESLVPELALLTANAPTDDRITQEWEKIEKLEPRYHELQQSPETYQWTAVPSAPVYDAQGFTHTDKYRAAVANFLQSPDVNVEYETNSPFKVRAPDGGEMQMWAAFRIGDLFLHVQRCIPEKRGPFAHHEWIRKHLFARDIQAAQHRHKILRPKEDFEVLDGAIPRLTMAAQRRLRNWLGKAQRSSAVQAAFDVQMPGMLRAQFLPQWLYTEGQFVESMGLEVEQLSDHCSILDGISLSDPIVLTVRLLIPFWRAFREVLQEVSAENTNQPLLRFHDVFSYLRNHEKPGGPALTHLLIDEFQDISPELLNWIQAVIKSQSGSATVLCVGDDWQSIYGWRGSDPEFLIHYSNYLRAPTMQTIQLTMNFRSRQIIIDSGEILLKDVKNKTNKHGKSAIPEPPQLTTHPVRLDSQYDLNHMKQILVSFSHFVNGIIADYQQVAGHPLTSSNTVVEVLILARTNNSLDKFQTRLSQIRVQLTKQLDREVDVKAYTFHRAKGLEADFSLLVDDVTPPPSYPFRDFIYKASNHPQNYTEAQRDETYRLGYVALTRAKYGVYWVADPKPDGAFLRLKHWMEEQGRKKKRSKVSH